MPNKKILDGIICHFVRNRSRTAAIFMRLASPSIVLTSWGIWGHRWEAGSLSPRIGLVIWAATEWTGTGLGTLPTLVPSVHPQRGLQYQRLGKGCQEVGQTVILTSMALAVSDTYLCSFRMAQTLRKSLQMVVKPYTTRRGKGP